MKTIYEIHVNAIPYCDDDDPYTNKTFFTALFRLSLHILCIIAR